MSFGDDLVEMGFQLVQTSPRAERYALRPNDFLTFWVHASPDTAEFTWEFELGAYLLSKGLSISVQDELSLLVFPGSDARGPADAAWVGERIEATLRHLMTVRLVDG